MIIANLPDHTAPMYISQPIYAVSPKMVKDTIYMPSRVAAEKLGNAGVRTASTRIDDAQKKAS
jgi:hypothetical protein